MKVLLALYSKDRIASLSAALAYYTTFSLAPVLLICITIAGWILGADHAQDQILAKTGALMGAEPVSQVQMMLAHANLASQGRIAHLIGISLLIFGTMGMFSEMQQGLNLIWGVQSKPDRSWFLIIQDRLFSFAVVIIVAFLLLAFLLLSLALTAISDYLIPVLNLYAATGLLLNNLLSFFIITLLFGIIFKILPDVIMYWREVWAGALITACLFTFGKYLLTLYFKYSQVTTIYGASSSLMIILIWIYYSAQIFFIGAEITKLLAMQNNKSIIPRHGSMLIESSVISQ